MEPSGQWELLGESYTGDPESFCIMGPVKRFDAKTDSRTLVYDYRKDGSGLPLSKEKAARIVRCVNAHDALVAAVETSLEYGYHDERICCAGLWNPKETEKQGKLVMSGCECGWSEVEAELKAALAEAKKNTPP